MKRFRRVVISVLAAVGLMAVAAPIASAEITLPSASPSQTAITGYVYGVGGVGASAWSVPLVNAGIYLVDPIDGQPDLQVKTNSAGNFGFNLDMTTLPSKQGVFFASPDHYYRAQTTLHSSIATPIFHKFICEVLPTIMTGKVTNKATGKPIAHAHVQVLNWDVYTNSQGVYTIHMSLQPNTTYKGWVEKSGFKRTKMHFKSLPTDKGLVRTVNFKMPPKK